jgi:hypothetical protein
VGSRLEVLVEGADPRRPGHALGTSCRYAPVSFEGHAPALLRRLVPVRVTGSADGLLLACPEPEPGLRPAAAGRENDAPRSARIPLPQVP